MARYTFITSEKCLAVELQSRVGRFRRIKGRESKLRRRKEMIKQTQIGRSAYFVRARFDGHGVAEFC
jgi:hypothetical protein